MFRWGIRAIDFVAIYLLIHSLLLLPFGLVFGFSTLGVRAFGMALSIMTLCIGSGCVHSISSITLGHGISVVGSLFCGGLVVLSKVTCRGSVRMAHSSGAGSGSCLLLMMLSSFFNASICSNLFRYLFLFKALCQVIACFSYYVRWRHGGLRDEFHLEKYCV